MFDEKEPEDILGDVGAGAPKPTPPTQSKPEASTPPPPHGQPSTPPPPAKTPPMKESVPEPVAPPFAKVAEDKESATATPIPPLKVQQGNLVKYFVIALLVILVLAAAGLISYWLLGRTAEPAMTVLDEEVDAFAVEVEEPAEEEVEPDPEPEPEPELDTDRDGLSDIQEAELGTSLRIADTDADGLSDYEELNTWNTDPLDPDTDGDSYIDGAEIDSGFDPNGPGQLFELPIE
jgi:hypothetical protein